MHPARGQRRRSSGTWRTCWTSTSGPTIPPRPLVCLDETSRQVLADDPRAAARRARAGRRATTPSTRGTGWSTCFLVSEPLRGWRQVRVSDAAHPASTWPHCIKELVDVHYPDAERIVLVMDHLNTHSPASLYEAFPPAEAKRLADKLEIHYTPKHGSWLNMAEIELSVAAAPVPGPAAGRPRDAGAGGGRLGGRAQRRRRRPSTGASPPPMPASSSSASTRHFTRDGPLVDVLV